MRKQLHAVYKNVTKKRGILTQINKLREEFGEFMAEVMLFLVNSEDASVLNLISEAGDVINMLMQIVIHFGGNEDLVNTSRVCKMQRELKRIEEEEAQINTHMYSVRMNGHIQTCGDCGLHDGTFCHFTGVCIENNIAERDINEHCPLELIESA